MIAAAIQGRLQKFQKKLVEVSLSDICRQEEQIMLERGTKLKTWLQRRSIFWTLQILKFFQNSTKLEQTDAKLNYCEEKMVSPSKHYVWTLKHCINVFQYWDRLRINDDDIKGFVNCHGCGWFSRNWAAERGFATFWYHRELIVRQTHTVPCIENCQFLYI